MKRNCGLLLLSTPQGLLNTVFFLNGKNLLFVVAQNIDVSNSLRFLETYHQRVKYAIHIFRTASRIVQVALIISVFQIKSYNSIKMSMLVNIIVSMFSTNTYRSSPDLDIFYLRPVANKPVDDSPWYISVAVGKNPLSKILKSMCEETGITGHKTNHSLRAYAATSFLVLEFLKRLFSITLVTASLMACLSMKLFQSNKKGQLARCLQ